MKKIIKTLLINAIIILILGFQNSVYADVIFSPEEYKGFSGNKNSFNYTINDGNSINYNTTNITKENQNKTPTKNILFLVGVGLFIILIGVGSFIIVIETIKIVINKSKNKKK